MDKATLDILYKRFIFNKADTKRAGDYSNYKLDWGYLSTKSIVTLHAGTSTIGKVLTSLGNITDNTIGTMTPTDGSKEYYLATDRKDRFFVIKLRDVSYLITLYRATGNNGLLGNR